VKQAAEAVLSTNFIGEANWVELEFLDTATADCVVRGRCVPPPHPRCMTDALSSSSVASYEKRTEGLTTLGRSATPMGRFGCCERRRCQPARALLLCSVTCCLRPRPAMR